MKKLTLFIISVPILLSVFIFIAIGIKSTMFTNEFNKSKWVSNIHERSRMIPAIEKDFQLIGKSSREIVELLGKPDYQDKEKLVYKTPSAESKAVYVVVLSENEMVTKTIFQDSDEPDFY